MRLIPSALLLLSMASMPSSALIAADNGCGCVTGEYGVTCCNPREQKGGFCTVTMRDEDGETYLTVKVPNDVDMCS